jgi:hypothetical protein
MNNTTTWKNASAAGLKVKTRIEAGPTCAAGGCGGLQ